MEVPGRNKTPPIVTLVAFCVWQDSSTALPGAGDGFGVAVNDVISGAGTWFTVTVAVAVELPAGLVAVNVYTVVFAGVTICDPANETGPRVEIDTVVAFWTFQFNVEL
jgi:hypothetical protein